MRYLAVVVSLLLTSCGPQSPAFFNLSSAETMDFKFQLGDLVYVRVNQDKVCRGYVAELYRTSYNHYKISPLICDGKQFYDLWVPEYDLADQI